MSMIENNKNIEKCPYSKSCFGLVDNDEFEYCEYMSIPYEPEECEKEDYENCTYYEDYKELELADLVLYEELF